MKNQIYSWEAMLWTKCLPEVTLSPLYNLVLLLHPSFQRSQEDNINENQKYQLELVEKLEYKLNMPKLISTLQ